MSLRAGDARGTSALRALVVVGVAGATMCGWVLVRNGSHSTAIGAASCPGCAGTASPSAHGTTPATPHSDAAHDSGILGALAGDTGSAPPRTAATHTHTVPPPSSPPAPAPAQLVRYTVDAAGHGTWLAVMRLTDQAATAQHDWTLRFALPNVRMVFSDYGTVTETGDVVTVAAAGKPLPRDGDVRILIDLGQQAGRATAPWPTDCQINQTPCAVTSATPATTAPATTGPADPTTTTPDGTNSTVNSNNVGDTSDPDSDPTPGDPAP